MRPFSETHEYISYSLPSLSGSPSVIQLGEYGDRRGDMSTRLLSEMTLPVFAKLVSSVGLGAAARSGGLPAATRVVRSASWSRLASYWMVIPVESVNGFMVAMKEACSAPVQVAMTLTDPAFVVELVPHATAVMTATSDRVSIRLNHSLRILKSPFELTALVPLLRESFYVRLLNYVFLALYQAADAKHITNVIGELRAASAHLL